MTLIFTNTDPLNCKCLIKERFQGEVCLLKCFRHFGNYLPEQVLQITDEPVYVALSGSLVDDIFVVVVPETSTQLLIVHLWLVFAAAPPPRDLEKI